ASTLSLNGYTLTLNNNITGSGTLIGSSTSSLVVGNTGTNFNLAMNQSSAATRSLLNYTQSRNATVTLSNPMLINGVVNLSGTNSILASGTGNLTLLSTAGSTSSIAALATSANVSGLVNVQSFFTGGAAANARGTRMISSPVNDASNSTTDSTVFQQLKNRMLITGPGGAANGFDVGTGPGPNAPNLVTYNEPVTTAVSQFNNVPDILFARKIAPGQNYFLFFRGNRTSPTNKFNAPFTAPENVTMTYKGEINKGTINVSTTKTNNGDANYDGFNAIGNPYPSTIDFDLFRASNSLVIDDLLSIIKPDRQGMVTYSNGVTVNNTTPYNPLGGTASALPARYIQPGQGFYIRKTATGTANVSFMESHKVAATTPPAPARLLTTKPLKNTLASAKSTFGATAERKVFRMNLVSTTGKEETAIVFEDGFMADFDYADAPYMGNNTTVLNTLNSNNNALAINFMPAINTVNQIPLTVNAPETGNCTLNFTDISPARIITLQDNYLNTQTEINESTKNYTFTIDKNVASSFGANRLVLKFKEINSLPINLLSFKATKINAGTLLSWKTLSETNNKMFIIQKSIDGKVFSPLTEIKGKG
ncbi:MAG: hypothetical protein EAY81_00260, partial [Bacteroidetes bacterium]